MVTLQLEQLVVQPGQCIQLQDISWGDFEAILEELADRHSSRIAYWQGLLEFDDLRFSVRDAAGRRPSATAIRSQILKAFRD